MVAEADAAVAAVAADAADVEGAEDEEHALLLHALRASDESDHEVFYDLGARAHGLGDAEGALAMYERAAELNPKDALLLGNMGAAELELGRPRRALRCWRRALGADRYDLNARYNICELLLEMGRRGAARALLAATPAQAMAASDELRGMAAELEADLGEVSAGEGARASRAAGGAAGAAGVVMSCADQLSEQPVAEARDAEPSEAHEEECYMWRELDASCFEWPGTPPLCG